MDNPLLSNSVLPQFSAIRPEHALAAIQQTLASNRAQLQRLLDDNAQPGWDNLVWPLEEMGDRFSRIWSPVSHLNSVMNSDAWRAAYNACLPLLSEYSTEIGQNKQLYAAYQAIADGPQYSRLNAAQQKIINNSLRDFHLSGVALSEQDKTRYAQIMQELSALTSKFSENVLDATGAWKKHIEDEQHLAGLPESAKSMARQTAEQEGKSGWLFGLDFPSYLPVMTYAEDRNWRAQTYEAYVTRASDAGPHAGQWDNTPVMEKILALRHELAKLLGFAHYADYSLATKMATSTQQVMTFLADLAQRSYAIAKQDLDEVRAFARNAGLDTLEAWDVTYYAEKLRQSKYAFSQEQVKPYFPEDRALTGMFGVVNKLYGLNISEVKGVEVWHPDVRFFEIIDQHGERRGQFYLDLYARPHKRGGAWMDDCVARRRSKEGVQIPVAYLTCNFSPPIGNDPALFTHEEVETLFHEFGHGLHHMLTKIDYPSVAGISGVAWDAVELPSQFMENWCWEGEALRDISGHYQSGEPLPQILYQRMRAAKNFQSGMQMMRQLEFAIFDFRIHLEYDEKRGGQIYQILNEVREQVSVIKPPSFNRFPHSFSHIFAGGYAAGYYSYKWAEVLSSDAFSKFEEQGIFDRETGMKFLTTILEQGGSREPMELFIEFRGREPQIDALLRHSGITAM